LDVRNRNRNTQKESNDAAIYTRPGSHPEPVSVVVVVVVVVETPTSVDSCPGN
jgi:hypothetical protein